MGEVAGMRMLRCKRTAVFESMYVKCFVNNPPPHLNTETLICFFLCTFPFMDYFASYKNQ